MRWKLVGAAFAAVMALVCAATVLAALPKKGANYVGEVKASPFNMRVLVGVSVTGKKVRFSYWCGTGRAPTVVFGIPLDATGAFQVHEVDRVAGDLEGRGAFHVRDVRVPFAELARMRRLKGIDAVDPEVVALSDAG